jgi:hypothetical protein
MNKKFKKALKPGISVRRTGFLGMGRKVEVTGNVAGGNPTYRVDRSACNEEMAAHLNSKIPVAVITPPRS